MSQADDALLVYAVNAQINEKWLVATPAQQEVKYTPDDFYGEWFSSYDEPDGYVDHQTLSICQNRITVKGENNNGGREYVVRNLSWTCDANGCTVEGTISEVIKDGV